MPNLWSRCQVVTGVIVVAIAQAEIHAVNFVIWVVSVYLVFLVLFFFFQAEDGIRDHCVTGVQTCALPILVVGTVTRRPAVIVAVPVIRGAHVRYVLDFPFEPAAFTRLLKEAALSPAWIATKIGRASCRERG